MCDFRLQWNADSVFVGLVGHAPPFLFAFGTRATFKNCLFKDVLLPHSELFDVSHYGSVSLLNCHFTNITTGHQDGLADTTYNDSHPVIPYASSFTRAYFGFYTDKSPYGYTEEAYIAYYGDLDHIAYDFELSPAAADAEDHYGSDYVIHNQAVSDFLAASLVETKFVLPGCPDGSVEVRQQHRIEQDAQVDYVVMRQQPASPQQLGGPTGYADPDDYDWLADYLNSKRAKEVNPFYAQYYPDDGFWYSFQPEYQIGKPAPSPDEYVYDGNSPQTPPGSEAYDYIIPYLGDQLYDDNAWFDAIQQVCVLGLPCECRHRHECSARFMPVHAHGPQMVPAKMGI